MSGFLTGTADCQLPREADVIDIDRIKACGRDELLDLAAALRSLADDLQLLGTGTMPVSEVTEAAPLLVAWALALLPQPCLVGQRFGHPRLRQDGRTTITSGLWAISGDLASRGPRAADIGSAERVPMLASSTHSAAVSPTSRRD